MSYWRILIVEDEQIVARDLQTRLKRMKYDVPTAATSAADALEMVASFEPQLVITDIQLGSEPDGIELAEIIRREYDIPVIYMTAFTDDDTLTRARVSEPYGYVVKPFNDRELQIAIEIGIYKHRTDQLLRLNSGWLDAILKSIGDAVIATDKEGRIVFINPAAQLLTGWDEESAQGMSLRVVFNVLITKKFFTPWNQFAGRENLKAGGMHENILISKTAREYPIQSTVSVLKNEQGREIGEVIVFKESTAIESALLPALQ